MKDKDKDSIVKQALQISIDLHYNGKNSFYSNLMKMVDYYDLNCHFPCIIHWMTLSYSKVKRYVGVMTNKSFLTGTRPLNNYKNSVSVYCTIKMDCSPSPYLVLTRKNPASRKALLKIRISSHQLRIETGRHKKKTSQWKDMFLL